jgi:hypothetical protein
MFRASWSTSSCADARPRGWARGAGLAVAGALAGCGDKGGDTAAAGPTVVESCAACDGACVRRTEPLRESPHTAEAVDYPRYPPSSGPHHPCWTDFGPSATPLPTERWLHTLEHGGVVILSDCPDGCPAEEAAIAALVPQLGPFALSTPAAAPMAAPFVAVAWGEVLELGCVDEDALRRFYDAHHDRAPESTTAGPGPSCVE